METLSPAITPISRKELLDQWQSQRRLTRHLIETFPEEEFFNYRLGGMPTFYEMSVELLAVTVPGLWGVLTGEWKAIRKLTELSPGVKPGSKASVLDRWDQATELINTLWMQIPEERLNEVDGAFDGNRRTIGSLVLSWIDNEIVQRAQAFVYLSALGIKLRAFQDKRSQVRLTVPA